MISVHQLCRYLQDRLYELGGSCQANLIVGGVYNGKAMLRAIHPHGSMDVALSYTALGSGGLAAMGVLESSFNSNRTTTIDEAVALAVQAVKAGIDHDLGSGSQVDVCVIGPDGIANYTRCVVPEETLQQPMIPGGGSEYKEEETVVVGDESSSSALQAGGVNGFGNVPFAIRSKKVLQVSREQQKKELKERWKDILLGD